MRQESWIGRALMVALAFPACAAGTCPRSDGAGGASPTRPWPTSAPVTIVDPADEFNGNLSGLSYEPGAAGAPDLMWGVRNAPARLYRLTLNQGLWTAPTESGWAGGRRLRFPDGVAEPDAEGVTRVEWTSSAIYVAAERTNAVVAPSRLSVLLFDSAAVDDPLVALREWNLTADLPVVDPNLGLEGITWVPDAFLVAAGFYDEAAVAAYDPTRYAGHGTGLFFVALEENGTIYAYALDHQAGGFRRVATIDSGQAAVVELEFDRDTGGLWSYCDIACHNKASVLAIGSDGRFAAQALFAAPGGLPDSNNEGFAIAPSSSCAAGVKNVWWADDDDSDDHSLRQGSVPCALPR